MQTIKAELQISGKKVAVGHDLLEDIVRGISDTKENKSLFDILVNSDNVNIRENIARNDNLSKKAINTLLKDKSERVLDSILCNRSIAKHISQKKIMKIIKRNNTLHVCTIADNIENFVKCDSCKLVKILSHHKNPLVRYNLLFRMVSDVVPTKTLKRLSKDKDIDVANEAKEGLARREK